jgi:hypothetical protein
MSSQTLRPGARARRVAAAIALGALCACAPKQRIPLEACVSEEMVVYVDGRLLEKGPAGLELRSDEPHKLYIKRPGEPPHLVVLETTVDGEGRARLEPADPCREIVARGLDRELTIEVEDDGRASPGPAPAP